MIQLAKPMALILVAAALSACSTPPPADPSTTLAALSPQEKGVADSDKTITGSRLPRKSTDRTVRQIDAAGAKDMDRSRAPNPGSKFN